ncbi:MAG: bifunctional 2-polyprenyl-6-hydroxyphenol methylase/3-demethylubiquinol 3-O-methyltransferase UbiG [Methyloligellaceae bacterium]
MLDKTTPKQPYGTMSGVKLDTDFKNLDRSEIDRFAALASEWWNPNGKFRTLHDIGPVRLSYIRDRICHHYNRNPLAHQCLKGLHILDIGCGGGLIAEPLNRLGANVTAIDPGPDSIQAARHHAQGQNLDIEYRVADAGELASAKMIFDAVLCLEVAEHVPDMPMLVRTCAELTKEHGLTIFSTIHRTLKSFALAIIGAEYILRWLPIGTHSWDRFITPEELRAAMHVAGLKPVDMKGLIFNPIAGDWQLSADTDVNYFAAAERQGRAKPSTDVSTLLHP